MLLCYIRGGIFTRMLKRVHIREYRSLLDLELRFDNVSMISGANGVGKSNCYKALALLKSLAEGSFARFIAGEGGMESALWGGKKRSDKPRRIIITVEHSQFEYHVEVGVDCIVDPLDPDPSMFKMDPKIRVERLKVHTGSSSRLVGARKSNQLQLLNNDWEFDYYEFPVMASESFLSQVKEPAKFPFVSLVKEALSSWRFYHEFDTSSHSPLRVPQVAFWSPKLEDGGENLASVIRTIWESGFQEDFDEIFEQAFPDMSIAISVMQNRLELSVTQAHLSRNLNLSEVSDGTLRFLCLAAALLSLDKPDLIVLNEPEMSLNESVYPAIAKLISFASGDSQVIVVTHATELASCVGEDHELTHIELALDEGRTRRKDHVGQGRVWEFD